MTGLIKAILSIALSLIVGAMALALCAYYFPDQLEALQISASYFKDAMMTALTNAGSKASINVWIRFLLSDEQLVFMFFVIGARVVLYMFFTMLGWMFSRAA